MPDSLQPIMLLPEALAVTAACCSALSSMFLSELKGRVPLIQLARWQMLATFVMTGSVSLATGGWHTIGPREFWLLAGSSFAGISIASTAYFATIYSVGPRITALLFSLTSPFALALGYLVLGETINHWQALGVLLVLCGIVLAIGMPRRFLKGGDRAPPMPVVTPGTVPISTAPAPPLTGRLWPGILLGVITAIGQAIGTLLARPAMAARRRAVHGHGAALRPRRDPVHRAGDDAVRQRQARGRPVRHGRARCAFGFRRHVARHVLPDGRAAHRQCRHHLDAVLGDADHHPAIGVAAQRAKADERRLGRRASGNRRHSADQPEVMRPGCRHPSGQPSIETAATRTPDRSRPPAPPSCTDVDLLAAQHVLGQRHAPSQKIFHRRHADAA
jgi:uncharacterized membrane protein